MKTKKKKVIVISEDQAKRLTSQIINESENKKKGKMKLSKLIK